MLAEQTNPARVDLLIKFGAVEESDEEKVKDYLNTFDPRALRAVSDSVLGPRVRDLLKQIINSSDLCEGDDFAKCLGDLLESSEFSGSGDFVTPTVLNKDLIAELRAVALLARRDNPQAADRMKKKFLELLASEFVSLKLPIPEALEARLSSRELAAIKNKVLVDIDSPELDEGIISLGQITDPNVHPKMARRKAVANFEEIRADLINKAAKEADELYSFVKNLVKSYIDPSFIIDEVLELKDGDLPV